MPGPMPPFGSSSGTSVIRAEVVSTDAAMEHELRMACIVVRVRVRVRVRGRVRVRVS